MDPALPRDTGLDARFEAELKAAIPGWKSSPGVVHHPVARRFEFACGPRSAVVEYRRERDLLIITHTFVPPECRGQGIAELLVRTALEFARSEKLRVVPQCGYVDVFFRRHPEFADLRAGSE
jgi:predicted GNAT family acetyltransferase